MVGDRIGRYEVTRVLGSGAMGRVYAAYDESLDREVALKVLRAQFAEDFERRQRFEREAKAIAALDHPNIVTIYTVEEDDGRHFLTMQLVEGQTLDEIVPAAGLPIAEFLDIAVRLVEAVSAAHQKGIVHRDLKATNVMVDKDGRLKVLDFGLAKLRDVGGSVEFTMDLTLEGQIIGTVAYMSPEQAEGRSADHRSDIFSLGVLMYEMATGAAPFDGDTPISVMSSIIKDTPSLVTDIRPGAPPHLARIIKTCLAKDPVRRYQSAIDLRNALDDLKEELQSSDAIRPAPVASSVDDTPPRRRKVAAPRLTPGAAVVAAVLLLAAGTWLGRTLEVGRANGNGPFTSPELLRLTSQAGLAGSPTWSPDGLELVYAADEAGTMDLWHQEEDGRASQITSLPGSETDPDWAPDEAKVAFTNNLGNNGISIISPRGGQPTQITTVGARPRWSPDGARLVYDWRGDIWMVDALPGAEPELVVSDTAGIPHAVWSIDGEYIYYWNRSVADLNRVRVDGSGNEVLPIVPTGQDIAGISVSGDGRFLIVSMGPYGGNKDLWKVMLDAAGRTTAERVRLTAPTTDDVSPALHPDGDRLAYAVRHVIRQLESIELDADTGRPTGPMRQLTRAADSNYYPALSADGVMLVWTAHHTSSQGLLYFMRLDNLMQERKATLDWDRNAREIGGTFSPDGGELIYTSTKDGNYELWRASCLADCVSVKLTETVHPARDITPSWAPEGNRVVFHSSRFGSYDIWEWGLDNGAGLNRLTQSVNFEMYPSISPDGDMVSYWTNREGGGGDIWIMDADGTNQRALIVNPAEEGWGVWSPDMSWFYFTSTRSGSFNVWGQQWGDGGVVGEPFAVTTFADSTTGLPESAIRTKFAVGNGFLVVPVERRAGGIWVLSGLR